MRSSKNGEEVIKKKFLATAKWKPEVVGKARE